MALLSAHQLDDILLSLVLNLQEVAGNHGVAIWGRTEGGFAADPIMVEQSLIFVATRIQLQLSEYPRWYVPADLATAAVSSHQFLAQPSFTCMM